MKAIFELVKERRDWIDMSELADLCKSRKVLLNEEVPKPNDLERELRQILGESGEYAEEGLALDGYVRRIGWDLVFMVRAYPKGVA